MLYVAAFIIATILLKADFVRFFGWWWTLVAAGVIFFPFSFLIFRRFNDCGVLFSSVLGIALMSWLSWFFSSIGFIPFTSWGCILVLLICAALNVGFIVSVKKVKGAIIPADYDFSSKIMPMLLSGLIMLGALIVWCYLRGYKPEALGTTESVMDYAIMKSLDRSYYMPATDMWLAGQNINYYYGGQFTAVFLSKISGAGIGYGYNLMLMTVAAFAFALPYSIVSTAFSDHARSRGVKRALSSHGAGIISGIALSLCGNFHYLLFYYVVPVLNDILGNTDRAAKEGYKLNAYFFPNSTRYIGHMPQTADKTIHEFPAYSFVIGDLHAHVINIIFVLCLAAVLYAYVQSHREKIGLAASGMLEPPDGKNPGTLFGIGSFYTKVFDPCVIIVAFFVGFFHVTNFWDYPIYFVVAGAVILYVNLASEGSFGRGFVLTVFHAAIVIIISKLVCLPFTLSFDQISSKIMFVETRTPLYQFIVLWGFPFVIGIVAICIVIKEFAINRKIELTGSGSDELAACKARSTGKNGVGKKENPVTGFLLRSNPSDIFILIIVLCAMGLTLIPEFVYIRDIYSGDYKRANTMFKISYQAFMLFGLSMGYILARLLVFGKRHARTFGAVCLCLLLLSAGYSRLAVNSWYTTDTREYSGLSSDAFLENYDIDEYRAILFLDEYVQGRPVIIEADGSSYTNAGRFSAWTGLPTVFGWHTHEWLWRSSGDTRYPEILKERENDIGSFYTSSSLEMMRSIIKKYNISFIIVGEQERLKYPDTLREDLLVELGETIFSNETVKIIEVTK